MQREVGYGFEEQKYDQGALAKGCAEYNNNVHRNNSLIWRKHEFSDILHLLLIKQFVVAIGEEMIDKEYQSADE